MCGIAGIILKQRADIDLQAKIVLMSDALKHRGPDGEGFMAASGNTVKPFFNTIKTGYQRTDLAYIPGDHIKNAGSGSQVAFAHRRLSIIDLTEAGHQPMCTPDALTWITFNGEIYNYIELRDELKILGHTFHSECDTEVVLMAYRQWGDKCVSHFNGMWSFCIYDAQNGICFASRDRLGVKPFYYSSDNTFFSFASEQKAFVSAGLVKPTINQKALKDYLFSNLPENDPSNFFENITELWPGNNLIYNLATHEFKTWFYYDLKISQSNINDALNEDELCEKIRETLINSVKIRLRSDVEVGTCLSGGIDSSALAVIISEINSNPLYCFTSIFRDQTFNEEFFADTVAKKIHATHIKVEPTLNGFLEEVDQLVYSQDVPIWDTSTYAQYKVMELAKKNGIKVVLDGQGADELFAGYHHHFVAKWNNLFAHGKYLQALHSISSSRRTIPSPALFYFKVRLKDKLQIQKWRTSAFFTKAFTENFAAEKTPLFFNDVNEQLIDDIYHTRLKSFLKCEDRCGMWHSVESRTPFSDDKDLIDLLFSFNGNKKIKDGVSKYLLREAVKDKLPSEIYQRYDKKGFETPMQQWMKTMRSRLLDEVTEARFSFVDYRTIERTDPANVFDNKMLFKLFILARWQKVFRV